MPRLSDMLQEKINEGIGSPKETLKTYASTLEEARADLVALYYIWIKN